VLSERVDSQIESTCAIGVDEMSWDDLNPAHYKWPTIERLREYRAAVRELVDKVIRTAPITLPINWESPLWIVLMGIEHERIHLETSSVLIRQLPVELVRPQQMWAPCPFATVDPAALPAPVSVGEPGYEAYNARAGADAASTRIVAAPGALSADRARASAAAAATETPVNSLLALPGGAVSLGKPAEHPLYGWDNEYGVAHSTIRPLSVSKYLVSNGEFLQFVRAGGYSDRQWWSEEGWGFVTYHKTAHPVFWVPVPAADAGAGAGAAAAEPVTYKYRAMAEEIEMPWAWPVDCNYLEAQAFCRWKDAQAGAAARGREIRLPTEAEWMHLREHTTQTGAGKSAHEDDQPYWQRAPGNINLEYWASSCPVNLFNHYGTGFFDVIGNVWQHTESFMAPYAGFKVHPAYDDFTVPTYDNMHNLFKGGAWVATGNEAQTLARYAFRRHFYQHAGFRYVEAELGTRPSEPQVRAYKETDPEVTNCVYEHYRDLDLDVISGSSAKATNAAEGAADVIAALGLPQYPLELAKLVATTVRQAQLQASQSASVPAPKTERVLELGCAAGRGTFELARTFDAATGVDFTTRVIRVGKELKEAGVVSYDLPEAGSLTSFHKVDLTAPAAAASGLDALRGKVDFVQADACNLDRTKFGDFDCVVIASGFNSLYSPGQLLGDLHTRVRHGGLVFIASDNSWDEARTPLQSWLGGYKDTTTGENVAVTEAIAEALGSRFVPVVVDGAALVQLGRKRAGQVVLTRVEVTAWRKVSE
jgi:putative 4-mercaptohistidine N1-methyltranferase